MRTNELAPVLALALLVASGCAVTGDRTVYWTTVDGERCVLACRTIQENCLARCVDFNLSCHGRCTTAEERCSAECPDLLITQPGESLEDMKQRRYREGKPPSLATEEEVDARLQEWREEMEAQAVADAALADHAE